ncbi:unnamed protein product [Larinioides sclopetarius]|uniref:NADH dehydrogenase subunit 4 n=1 Tax=Larinioides sclopetarius TaxID=280406 RepID=A0AAV2B6M0_9ARAC
MLRLYLKCCAFERRVFNTLLSNLYFLCVILLPALRLCFDRMIFWSSHASLNASTAVSLIIWVARLFKFIH